jgi:hypothetical protein
MPDEQAHSRSGITVGNLPWKGIGQWVMIIVVLIGAMIYQDRRITTLEAGSAEDMKGYNIVFAETNRRLGELKDELADQKADRRRLEAKVDQLILSLSGN